MVTGDELECQNPAKSFVGIDRIRLEKKQLRDSARFAEGLHEAEQNSKKDALSYLARAVFKRHMQ